MIKYATVCSGIEAPSVAWEPLGWQPVWFSQYDPEHNYKRGPDFPSRVLNHYYPTTPNLGDMLQIDGAKYRGSIDLICGGTPCQSFSIAGLRGGLSDNRGNLALQFVRLVDQIRPRWFIWENVPGVLSSNAGRDFGSILGAMAYIGYSCTYRVLDAQFFGVPQRRRRVFVVGHIGDWQRAASVLFEPEGVYGDFEPSRKARQRVAVGVENGFGENSKWPATVTQTLDRSFSEKYGFDNQHINSGASLFVPHAFQSNAGHQMSMNPDVIAPSLTKNAEKIAVFRAETGGTQNFIVDYDLSPTANKMHTGQISLHQYNTVRRITPLEAERLQGFPDNYTNIPGASDSARYAALGNSMAVPVMRWIGERINLIDQIPL